MTDFLPPPALDRTVLRERARLTHQRRVARLQAMRCTVAALERAAPVMLTLSEKDSDDDDDDVQWDGFLYASAMRVRRLMRQSLQLTKEVQVLETNQRQLHRLLREHRLASRVLSGLLGAAEPVDAWEADLQRWRQLTRKYFKPWTLWDCAAEIDEALKEINTLLWRQDTHSTGVSFLGWRDRRAIDPVHRSFKFVFHKDFVGFDMMEFIQGLWRLYTDADLYQTGVMGGLARSSIEMVQPFSPTMGIFRFTERYATFDAHLLYLIFRVETDRGYTQCVRPIQAPQLQAAINGPKDVWASNNIWFKWEPLRDDLQDFRLYCGGYLTGTDIQYANRWLVEALASLVRGEAMITRRPLLQMN